jgi:drug/metabolite transporter (DMT)-like permease
VPLNSTQLNPVRLTHIQALALFVLATFLWAIAGPITRLLSSASGFEVTFWRSVFAALTVFIYGLFQKRANPIAQVRAAGLYGLVSGLMWSVMFCCFMIALSMTTAANVLLTQSTGPILTALLSWAVFKQALGMRTWAVIFITCSAIAAMYIQDVSSLGGQHIAGVVIAFGIPCAAAVNWVVQQKALSHNKAKLDLTSSVMLGAVISALVMLPFALPFRATFHDVALLAFLGVFQLGIPCVIVVRIMSHVAAHEASLISLLEVVFGIALTWLFAGEKPGTTTLVCGGIVIFALLYNEWVKTRTVPGTMRH